MVTTYKEMNERIVGLLRIDDENATGMYAAQRIEELEAQAKQSAEAIEWLLSGSSGISSMVILAFMEGIPYERLPLRHRGFYPRDRGDFGRCHYLMTLIPEYRKRLPEMKGMNPEWATLIEHWDELDALYTEDMKQPFQGGRSCSVRMQELLSTVSTAGTATG